MKVNTVYTSDDGQNFNSREACLEWEKNLPLVELVQIWCPLRDDAKSLVRNLLALYVVAKKK